MTKKATAVLCFVLDSPWVHVAVVEILPPPPRQEQDGATTSVTATISPGEDSQAGSQVTQYNYIAAPIYLW